MDKAICMGRRPIQNHIQPFDVKRLIRFQAAPPSTPAVAQMLAIAPAAMLRDKNQRLLSSA